MTDCQEGKCNCCTELHSVKAKYDAARAERDEFEAAAQAKHCVHPGWVIKAQQAEKLEVRTERAEADNAALRAGLERLVEYVEDNRKYIPLHMGSRNTGAVSAALELLASPSPGAELLAELERLSIRYDAQILREAARKARTALSECAAALWEPPVDVKPSEFLLEVQDALAALDAALGEEPPAETDRHLIKATPIKVGQMKACKCVRLQGHLELCEECRQRAIAVARGRNEKP